MFQIEDDANINDDFESKIVIDTERNVTPKFLRTWVSEPIRGMILG